MIVTLLENSFLGVFFAMPTHSICFAPQYSPNSEMG